MRNEKTMHGVMVSYASPRKNTKHAITLEKYQTCHPKGSQVDSFKEMCFQAGVLLVFLAR
jgi:hypothetical protein